jgi:Tol biopolymer transport system component
MKAIPIRFPWAVRFIPAAALFLPLGCSDTGACGEGNPLMPVCAPQPAADEPRIVFSSNLHDPMREDLTDVYTMTSRGTDIRRLTTTGGADIVRWSPDGRRIAYAEVAPPRVSLIVMNADGTNSVNISRDSAVADGYPSWSPDGRRIAFHSNRHNLQGGARRSIYVMDADGSNVMRLTSTDSWNDRAPDWSPDGTRIAFISNRVAGVMQIFVMNADGTNQRQLTTEGTNLYPNWSPDGTRIVFSSQRTTNGMPDNGLYLINADGTGERPLTRSGTMVDMFSTWSADGTEIYFCSTRSGMHIWRVTVADGVLRPLTNLGSMSMEGAPNARRQRPVQSSGM